MLATYFMFFIEPAIALGLPVMLGFAAAIFAPVVLACVPFAFKGI